jgi:hypothetical protein
MHLLNTHNYDNKLKDICKNIIEKYQPLMSFEETIEKVRELAKQLNYNRINQVDQALNLFIHDKNGNYDSTNDIRVEDLLVRLFPLIEKWEDNCKIIFLEQIADVMGGTCPQGRCTRLIQLF